MSFDAWLFYGNSVKDWTLLIEYSMGRKDVFAKAVTYFVHFLHYNKACPRGISQNFIKLNVWIKEMNGVTTVTCKHSSKGSYR